MSLNRFELEGLASRALGIALPPYYVRKPKNGVAGKGEDFEGEEQAALRRAEKFVNEAKEAGDWELRVLVRQNVLGFPMAMPLDIEVPGRKEMWTFPWEPLVTVKGKNVITRRRVAKSDRRGTVKEYWTQDDFEIDIQGMMMNYYNEQIYPKDDIDILRRICEARKSLRVNCGLLRLFGIGQIVIEDFELPFTKGENAQGFVLKAYSDDQTELLIDEKILKQK